MKSIILSAAITILTIYSFGQQEYSYTNYFEANSFYNPAATGTDGTQNITALFRKQWAGFDGSPMNGGLVYENQLSDYNMGIGGYAFIDQIGATTMTSLAANYSYSLKLNDKHNLAFGIDAGADIYSTDYNRLVYWDDDEMFDNQSPISVTPRVGFGVHYYTESYYVGISVPRIVTFNNDSPISISSSKMPSIVSNYYLSGGYKFPIGSDFEMQINMLGKYTPRILPQGDLNVMATYKSIIGLGAGYKSLGFASAYLQYSYEGVVTIGYAFDFTVTEMANYSSGSHEIMIKYTIPKKKAISSSIK